MCSGRKLAALAYVLIYGASCVTKHWSSYQVLMLGRLFGGIATSLLFSTFEAWLVSEHLSVCFAALCFRIWKQWLPHIEHRAMRILALPAMHQLRRWQR